jgi:TonB family C-terminal domain
MTLKLLKAAVLLSVVFLNFAASVQAAPRLNGMAVHVQLGEEYFIAALYADTLSMEARDLMLKDEDKAIELRVLTDNLFARRFQRMWIEGIAINAGATEMEKHAQSLASFSNALKFKMTKGDILRIERLTAEKSTKVYLNRQLIETLPNAQFFDLLLRTWLGPVPLSSQFKEGLLAGGKVDAGLTERFNNTTPSAARIAEISAAIAKPAAESPAPRPTPATPPAVATAPPSPPATETPSPEQPPAAEAPAEDALAATPPPPEPDPEPEKLITEANLFGNETLFDDEDNDAYSFTAENLLSEQIYIAKLTKWTSNFVTYPRGALRNQQEGTVRLTVTLARDGRVKDVQILEKSEYDTLNKAATRAVKSASPYPAVPDTIAGEQFLFTVPVVFRLN